ncbi:LytTR family DNA-binding domain-containing protein [Mucilaginibacter sp. FT3.2]|uniref:LytTR family transcriptional regulator DNA-binding domain-containing protein n=1 Tax=Mucilaginibacter sp. FT3.2 TaxID=2723090 RepID=UPI0021072C07|nr:LytTR family DNA-binding domain-containing protein [Mucilaginibacter sp. FT3.2]
MKFINFGTQFFNNKIDYPLRYQSTYLSRIVLIQFLLIFVTLYLFKPFTVNVAEQKFNYLTICCLHALSPALIVYLYVSTLTRFRKRHLTNDWTLKKEFFHVAIIFLIIGLSGFLLRGVIYTNPDNVSWHYLWAEIRNAYLAGIVFCFYLIFTKLYVNSIIDKSTGYHGVAVALGSVKQDLTAPLIFIKAHVRIDDFYFKAEDLLFAKASGNYITFTTFKDGFLRNELKRISLKQLEIQLAAYPYLLRCHRGYLLNVQRVVKLSGNSQGYLISFDRTEDKVPVSRAYLNVFDQIYKQANVAC